MADVGAKVLAVVGVIAIGAMRVLPGNGARAAGARTDVTVLTVARAVGIVRVDVIRSAGRGIVRSVMKLPRLVSLPW